MNEVFQSVFGSLPMSFVVKLRNNLASHADENRDPRVYFPGIKDPDALTLIDDTDLARALEQFDAYIAWRTEAKP